MQQIAARCAAKNTSRNECAVAHGSSPFWMLSASPVSVVITIVLLRDSGLMREILCDISGMAFIAPLSVVSFFSLVTAIDNKLLGMS